MSDRVNVATLPTCDLCAHYGTNDGTPAEYDGRTTMGPWANMCPKCFGTYGVGLGTGRGQKLILFR